MNYEFVLVLFSLRSVMCLHMLLRIEIIAIKRPESTLCQISISFETEIDKAAIKMLMEF